MVAKAMLKDTLENLGWLSSPSGFFFFLLIRFLFLSFFF